MVRVFHVVDYAVQFREIAPAPWRVEEVARVNGTMNEAYHLTNHIDEAWHEQQDSRLQFVGKEEPRSTSVGDMMNQDGVWYIVAGVGFKEVPDFGLELSAV